MQPQKKITVEIASTPETREIGLMFRKSMGNCDGMLFAFDSSRPLSFWGKNTYMPLDIAFINDKLEIVEIKKIVPLSTKAVSCEKPCKYALEVNSNFFSNNSIQIGDKLKVNNKEIFFDK